MLNGFLSNKFKIVDSSENLVKYNGVTAKYLPGYTLLEKGQVLQNELNLSTVYDISFGHHDISYSTMVMYCEHNGDDSTCSQAEITELSTGIVDINIINE